MRGLLNPEGPAKTMGGNIAIMDYPAAQMAFGKEGRIDRIDVSLLQGEDLETVRERIRKALPAGLQRGDAGRQDEAGRDAHFPFSEEHQPHQLHCRVRRHVSHLQCRFDLGGPAQKGDRHPARPRHDPRARSLRCSWARPSSSPSSAPRLGLGVGILFARSAVGAVAQAVSELYVRTTVTEIAISWPGLVIGFVTGIIASISAALFPALTSTRISPVSAIRSVPYSDDGFLSR